jgi:hypothetical protein
VAKKRWSVAQLGSSLPLQDGLHFPLLMHSSLLFWPIEFLFYFPDEWTVQRRDGSKNLKK